MRTRGTAKKSEVVVITGASAGVGRATAREFALRGAWIGLISRSPERLEAVRREVEAAGGRALVLPLDVGDANAVEAAAEQVERAFGPIDIWVNNAMVSVFAPVKETTAEEFRRVTEVTYLGYVHGTLAALKRMQPRNRGTIVQVGSALAYRSIPLQAAYCAAKHAIVGFTDSLRCELHHDKSKVRLTAVHLPALNTPQFDWSRSRMSKQAQPVPPIFQPEVAARAIFWAAHKCRREVYVGHSTTQAIVADKFFPGLLDRYLGRSGYQAQQTDEPKRANQPDNLYDPPPGDYGAHGRFNDRARGYSTQFWLSRHRVASSLTALGLGLAAGYALFRASEPDWGVDHEGLGYEAMVPDASRSRGKLDDLTTKIRRSL